MNVRRLPRFVVALLALTVAARAEVHLRWNQAGYAPAQPKVVIAMSDTDLRGTAWTVERVPAIGAPVLRGAFGASLAGAGPHTPLPFNHAADLGALREPGAYRLLVPGAAPADVRIGPAPYARLLELPLRHLRMVRSGSNDVPRRKFSHPGDARAPVFVPDGDPANGKWKPAAPARTVDARGGWYDAGDQIKFTLTIAYTTYHLLFAYRLEPGLFRSVDAGSGQPAILAEARHGLEYLLRVHPDRDTFVIQVGNAEDHNQEDRLPEHDQLDGRRPALCALSRVHLASTAAALAIGARTFAELGAKDEAARYAAAARRCYARALEPDTIGTAFERDDVNDFYRDPSDADQLALAAMELHALTGEADYLAQARRFAPPPGTEAGWHDWHWLANLALASDDAGARQRLRAETAGYARHAAERGAPWDSPGRYVWGSLARWIGDANAACLDSRRHGPAPDGDRVFWSMVDYTFGRNNWGVSFLFSRDLPNSVRNLYSPLYRLLGEFPAGALSEGPGGRQTHDSLSRYFKIPADDPFHRFNTPAAVFFDNATDFMCQEATIGGQADIILMLVLATAAAEAR